MSPRGDPRSSRGVALGLALLAVAGCSLQSQVKASPSPSAKSRPSPSPSPSPASQESPLPAPSVAAGIDRCHTSQLEVGFLRVSGAAAHGLGDLEFRNKSNQQCYVYGYIGMQMLDGNGHPLETHVVRDAVTAPTSVLLPPASPALGVDSTGHAHFALEWVTNCDVTGTHFAPEQPATLVITPPDETRPLMTSAQPRAGSPMSVCPGQEPPGTVHTRPVEPAQHE